MFLVCGEALMDVFAVGDTSAGVALDARVGGSPFNLAVGLARLGQPVSFFGAVSSGFLGERLMRALRDEGVGTETVTRVDAPTTLAVVGLDEQRVPSYAFYGEGAADRRLERDALELVPSALRAVHVGSYATVTEPAASTLRALVEQQADSHTVVCFDPNIRLSVEPELSRWREMAEWMLPRTHLLKISEEDLALLLPGVEPQQFAEQAQSRGVRLVVVTRGSEGAIAWSGSARADAAAPVQHVIDTVGAGDSFQAALLTWLAEQGRLSRDALDSLPVELLAEAMRFAVHAATLTCGRRGANLPLRHELGGAGL